MTVSRKDGTEQAEKELCICCPTAVFPLFCSPNNAGRPVPVLYHFDQLTSPSIIQRNTSARRFGMRWYLAVIVHCERRRDLYGVMRIERVGEAFDRSRQSMGRPENEM